MGKILRVLILVGIASFVAHHYGFSGSKTSESGVTKAEAAQISHQQSSVTIQKDYEFLNGYLNAPNQARSFPYGSSTQTMSLPSGRVVDLDIVKTKTGWCPIRREPTFSVSLQVRDHAAR